MRIFDQRRLAWLIPVVALVGLLALGPGERAAAQEGPDAGPATRTVALVAGWNLVGWTGEELPVGELVAQLEGVFDQIDRFDRGSQSFELVTATGPSFLNTLERVSPGDAL